MPRNALRAVIATALLIVVCAVGFAIWTGDKRPPAQDANAITSAVSATPQPKIKFYRNPMGLPDTSPVPKKDSMGMDYIAVLDGDDANDGSVSLSPVKVQRTGVETTIASRRSLTRTIKAPGVVQFDETRVAVVAPRFEGFVVAVAPVTTGSHVKKGDELATVFGQEILNQAARLLVEDQGNSVSKDRTGGIAVGATRRLRNLGVPDEFVEQVKRERRVPDTFTVRAPMSGALLERNIVDGQGFKAGDVAFRIADHSEVWMLADVAESDLDALKIGQAVRVSVRAHPGRTFSGGVSLIYPHLMKETRTARVRIALPNSDFALLPDMYGDVEIATGGGDDPVAVPVSAVIDSGNRQVVLVEKGDGRYEPRAVQLGRKGDGFVEIMGGVAEGDKVVVNGNFLIDAESNLQSALKGFSEPAKMEATP